MRWMWNKKDGGPESRVWMYGLESKRFGSVLVLRFEDGSREAYHNHAFNCLSWVLRGLLLERFEGAGDWTVKHPTSWRPFKTWRDTFHKVNSVGRTWVLTLRGPWTRTWYEYLPYSDGYVQYAIGRREVSRYKAA